MSVIYKPRLLGKHVGIVLTPLAEDDLAEQTAFTITGRAGKATITRRRDTERVDADAQNGADRDWTKKDWTLNLEALKLVAGPDMEDLLDTYTKFKCVITTKRGTQVKQRTFYGLSPEDSWDKEIGKNTDRLTLERISVYDSGTGDELDNPAVAIV